MLRLNAFTHTTDLQYLIHGEFIPETPKPCIKFEG